MNTFMLSDETKFASICSHSAMSMMPMPSKSSSFFCPPHFPHLVGKFTLQQRSVQFSSVSKSCPTLCDPMDHSTPGLPVHHQLPGFTETHVHQVGDAIQPSYPRSSPSPPAPIPPSIRVFSNESALHIRQPKYWGFSFNISPMNTQD